MEKNYAKASNKPASVMNITSISHPTLRKLVLRKVAEVLSSNGFEKKKAQKLSLLFENRLRSTDPEMGTTYRTIYKTLIKDIKNFSASSYTQLKKHKS